MRAIDVGIYEAKTQLSKLIKELKNGLQITITQRGHAVASLVPYCPEESMDERRRKSIQAIRHFRKGQKPIKQAEALVILKAGQK